MMLALGVEIALELNIVPNQYRQGVFTIQILLAYAGYHKGALWSPPRRPWSSAERRARGLPPLRDKDPTLTFGIPEKEEKPDDSAAVDKK